MAKEFGGIQSLFDNAICPVPGGTGDGAMNVGGVDIRDGQKQTAGSADLPNATMGVSLRDDSGPGMFPKGIKGGGE